MTTIGTGINVTVRSGVFVGRGVFNGLAVFGGTSVSVGGIGVSDGSGVSVARGSVGISVADGVASSISSWVCSGVSAGDGFKSAIGTLQRQQAIKRETPPKIIFPLRLWD